MAKNCVLTQNKAKLCNNLITTLVFEKNAIFFAENSRKSQKIVIITSTSGHPDCRRAIHVGNLTFNDGVSVEKYLIDDVMQSVKPWIETIIEKNYRLVKSLLKLQVGKLLVKITGR
jgi:hypothetical protein